MELRQKNFESNTNQITQVSKNKKKDVQFYEHLSFIIFPYLMKTVVLLCFVDSGRSLIDNLKSRHLIVLDE